MAEGASSGFSFTLLSNEGAWIRAGDRARVDRIGIDIERLKKRLRQRGLREARISRHRLSDLRLVVEQARHATPFARLNPLHAGTAREVNRALAFGARSLMLPYFRTASEAARFVRIVDGRAEVSLLVETGAALARLHDIARVPGIAEIMLGLNDLHLELRVQSPLELAASDLVRSAADRVRGRGLRFGFGGIARLDSPSLPVPPDLLLARYVDVGANTAWIARSFFVGLEGPAAFDRALQRVRRRLERWRRQTPKRRAAAWAELSRRVRPS